MLTALKHFVSFEIIAFQICEILEHGYVGHDQVLMCLAAAISIEFCARAQRCATLLTFILKVKCHPISKRTLVDASLPRTRRAENNEQTEEIGANRHKLNKDGSEFISDL